MPYLNIIDGPGMGNTLELDEKPLVLGRDPSVSNIPLNSLHISRRHARIWEQSGQYFLQDLRSQNGTFVNGLQTDVHPLEEGDEVALGEIVLTYSEISMFQTIPAGYAIPWDEPGDDFIRDTLKVPDERLVKLAKRDEKWQRVPEDVRTLAIVNEIAQLADNASSVEQFLDSLMDVIMAATGAERGALLLVSGEAHEFTTRVIRNPDKNRPPFSEAIVDYVLNRGMGILSTDPMTDIRFDAQAEVEASGLQSTLCVPLRYRTRIVGVIHINSTSMDSFSQKDLLLVTAAAAQAAWFIREVVHHQESEKQEPSKHTFRRSAEPKSLVVGKSRQMLEIIETIRLVAPTDSTVLLRGESGTGKEVIARAIHRQSERRDNSLVIVNCAALSPSVLESELFGHEKGAFTGASHRRLGRFELADKGTIFLDEIGEIPLELQSKLLRVLQDHQFERVGGEETIDVDLRVIAATNRNLPAAISKGTFREDLYFRLKVVELIMPPLRERPQDVPLLAQHFVQRYAIDMGRPVPKLSASALTELQQYPWPGNIRELKNVLERAMVLTQDNTITAANLTITTGPSDELVQGDNLSLDASEERQVRRVLVMTEWHKSRAAELLHVSRTRLDRMIKKYGIEKE